MSWLERPKGGYKLPLNGARQLRGGWQPAPVLAVLLLAMVLMGCGGEWERTSESSIDDGVATETGIPIQQDQIWTFGNLFLENYGQISVVLDSVVAGPDAMGLEVVETAAHVPQGDAYATAETFPPAPGYELNPVLGTEILPGATVQIVVAVRLEPGASSGRIPDWIVRYEQDGAKLEVVLEDALFVSPSGE